MARKQGAASRRLPTQHHRTSSRRAQQATHHDRAGGQKVDELGEEGLPFVLGIVLARQVGGGDQYLNPNELVAALLKTLENVADQATVHAIWLQHDEGAL